MGLRIIDKNTKPMRNKAQALALQIEAKKWAERKLGDIEANSLTFLAKIDDIRKLDSQAKSMTEKVDDLSIKIRMQSHIHIHDEQTFDLERILNLI